MRIIYHADQEKRIYVKFNRDEYVLSSGESLDIGGDKQQNNVMQIYTQQTAKMSILSVIVLLLQRIIFNIANVIIMNFPVDWLNELDPFTLSATHKVDCQTIALRYKSPKILKPSSVIEKPQLMINNKLIDMEIKFDINSVERGYIKYCFDLVSLWIYCSLLTSVIFIYSGKFVELIVVYALILIFITLFLILKIKKAYNEKQKLIKSFLSYIK